MTYQPMSLAGLVCHLSRQDDEKVRWKHVWEFFEDYRRAPVEERPTLLSRNRRLQAMRSGMCCWPLWRNISLPR